MHALTDLRAVMPPVHPRLRCCVRRVRDHGDPDPATGTPSQRVRRAVGADTSPRAPRPHDHLERAPIATDPRGVHPALQHASTPPRPQPARTGRPRRRHRDRPRPTDPTSQNLRRAHQRVPPRSLNHRRPAEPSWPQASPRPPEPGLTPVPCTDRVELASSHAEHARTSSRHPQGRRTSGGVTDRAAAAWPTGGAALPF